MKKIVLYRHILYALPSGLMFLLAFTPGISMSEDLGRHLLLGRLILSEGIIPETNLLTFTWPNFPFVNHHWLSEVVFYIVHRMSNLNALIAIKAILMTVSLAIAMYTVRLRQLSPLYAFTGILCAVAMAYRVHIRPEIFTYLGVALYGWFLTRISQTEGRKQLVWWLLLILYGLFWANAHIYFIFGVGMTGAYILSCWLIQIRDHKTCIRMFPYRGALALTLLILVCCINPNGWQGFLYPFNIFRNYGITITENRSPFELWKTVINPMLLALPFLTLITLYGLLITIKHRRTLSPIQLTRIIIAITALISVWMMARSSPLIALALPPLIADAILLQQRTVSTRWTVARRAITLPLVLLLNLLLIFSVLEGKYCRIFPSPIGPTPFGLDDESRYMAIQDLQSRGLSGPVFSDYNIGSLVEYNLYPEPAYVDNRPEAFPASFWQNEYIPSLALSERWRQLVTERNIRTVIVSLAGVGEGFIQAMMNDSFWQLVHIDYFCAIWVRRDAENADFLQDMAFTEEQLNNYLTSIAQQITKLDDQPCWRKQIIADQIIYEIYSLICLGRPALAWPLIWKMHLCYPDYQIVHELMRVCAPPYATPAVVEVLKEKARYPLAAKQVLDYGSALEQMGKVKEAKQVYRHGRLFFPLSKLLQERIKRGDPSM